MHNDVVIIGAGASGLSCAIAAGRRRRSVLVIDHAPKTGSKIRISGGGRCNFSNLHVSAGHYISLNPHFAKSALSRFSPDDVMLLLRKHRVPFREKEAGQLFCNISSSAIIDLLEKECRDAGVEILLNCQIRSISKDDDFVVTSKRGVHQAASLVVASGGLSWPSLGATNIGMQLAEQFGIGVVPPRPGLVPLVFSGKQRDFFRDLSGISFPAEVSCGPVSFQGNVLCTHRGLSGPAILQISSYWQTGDVLSLNLLPDMDVAGLLFEYRASRKEIGNLLTRYLPSRFIRAWAGKYAPGKPLCSFTEKELRETALKLCAWEIIPTGTEGYDAAEVTVGGVDTHEVSSRTMETKKVPGLFFIGEVLDVTGHLGGYNLHWAWASGHAAGQHV